MAEAEQSYTTEVEASVEDCCAVLLDFERYPAWSGPTTACRVLERDADGRAKIVEMTLDMKIRNVRYVLAYDYDLPRRADWHLVEGDVTGIVGSYEFEPLGTKRTRATCRQSVDLGFWIPGPLRRMIERQALRDSVNEFKAEAERRAKAPR
ncbi:MAG: SRPBCC family protein [Thermodesulfobacteriota bacterium]